MAKMKDSGIEWIGQIPEDWKLERIQWHLIEINEKNVFLKAEQVLSLTNKFGVIPYEEKGNQGNKAKTDLTEYKIAYPNTIVANSMNILIGSVGISKYIGCVSPVYYVFQLKNNKDDNIEYLNYIMQIEGFQKELRKYAKGILEIRLRVSTADIFKQRVMLPKKSIQDSIVKELGEKCSRISYLSTCIEEQIKNLHKYKMSLITETVSFGLKKNRQLRQTSVQWISEIPVDWKLSKIKYEIFPLSRSVKHDDDVITCFRDGQVTLRKNRREEGFTVSFTENGYQGVNVGDLVIHGMDTFAGAIGCSDSRGKTTPVVHVCKTSGNNRYFMYYLRSLASNDVLWFYANGIRVRSSDFRNFNNLGKFSICVPPLSEQTQIADYLDKKCSEIDSVIASKQKQLETLEEYKKSLIFEYVTGKKEVK